MKLIFDCYALLNIRYSGIPNVVINLMHNFITRKLDCLYTFGYRILDNKEIESLLSANSGLNAVFDIVCHGDKYGQKFLSRKDFSERIYFSPHTISCTKVEGMGFSRIIHDITPINFPEFHTHDVTETEGLNILEDIKNCDVIFTDSVSSKIHIEEYFPESIGKLVVNYPGVSWTTQQIQNCMIPLFDKPYVLILGTLEPRKNIELIIRYLLKHRQEILDGDLVYVIAGQKGWGKIIQDEDEKHIESLLNCDRLIFTGYVEEEKKMSLIAGARYMIYPSFCEGFGLPVAEAFSVGTPVVCSFGGSLPEAGGNAAIYFSPYSLESLENAIQNLETQIFTDFSRLRTKCMQHASKFTWASMAEGILNQLDNLYSSKIDLSHTATSK